MNKNESTSALGFFYEKTGILCRRLHKLIITMAPKSQEKTIKKFKNE